MCRTDCCLGSAGSVPLNRAENLRIGLRCSTSALPGCKPSENSPGPSTCGRRGNYRPPAGEKESRNASKKKVNRQTAVYRRKNQWRSDRRQCHALPGAAILAIQDGKVRVSGLHSLYRLTNYRHEGRLAAAAQEAINTWAARMRESRRRKADPTYKALVQAHAKKSKHAMDAAAFWAFQQPPCRGAGENPLK